MLSQSSLDRRIPQRAPIARAATRLIVSPGGVALAVAADEVTGPRAVGMHMARTENDVVVTTAIAGADRLLADRPWRAGPRRKGGCHGVVNDAVTAVRL